MALAQLLRDAHQAMEAHKAMSGMEDGGEKICRSARVAVEKQMKAIDVITRRIIGLNE